MVYVYMALCTLAVLLAVEQTASSTSQALCNDQHSGHSQSATAGEREKYCLVETLHSSSQTPEENYRKCDERRSCTCPWINYCGDTPPSSHIIAQSKPRNLTISAAPTGTRTFEVTALWDVDENDATITGYEIYMHVYSEAVACACISNRNLRQISFNFDVSSYRGEVEIILEVITRPYRTKSINRAFLRYTGFSDCAAAFVQKPNRPVCRLQSLQASQVTAVTEFVPNNNRIDLNNRLTQVTLSWDSQPGCCQQVLVALVDIHSRNDMSCSAPNRNPPCFVVRYASSVTIGPLDTSVQYSANLYTFTSSECSGTELAYTFAGCNRDCCNESVVVPRPNHPPVHVTVNPTSANTQSIISSTSITVVSTTHTRKFPPSHSSNLMSHSPSASGTFFPKLYSSSHALGKSIPITQLESQLVTSSPPTSYHVSPPASALPSIKDGHPPNSKEVTTGRTTVVFGVVGVVGGVIIIVVMVLLGVLYAKKHKRKYFQPASSDNSETRIETLYPNSSVYHSRSQPRNGIPPPPRAGMEHWNVTSNRKNESGALTTERSYPFQDESSSHSTRSSCEDESICITLSRSGGMQLPPLEVGSPASDMTTRCESILYSSPAHSRLPRAVIVYSPNSRQEDKHLILQLLVSDLKRYGVETKSHDITCIRESPSQWLEKEIGLADAVLCVCNKEFQEDWENFTSQSTQHLPLISSLKHLVHATVNQGKSLSKYATVLLSQRDNSYIPSLYLQGDPRQFLITDVEDIARFVQNIPSYCSS